MIDIHTHILPEIDDGSRSLDMSIEMLQEERKQGVSVVVLTPHFYASQNSPEVFLERRNRAYQQVLNVWTPELPELHLGAEVHYFDGICQMNGLNRLCMDGGETLLLEMPFHPWSRQMVQDVMELNSRSNIQVILAHIERYFSFAPADVWEPLRKCGVLMQSNADFFLDWKTRRKALKMYKNGEIHFLASDCHNMTARAPNLGEAMKYIQSK